MRRFAQITLMSLFSATIVFHALVLMAVIPPDIVWGSRLSSKDQLFLFESISILLNMLFLLIIMSHSGILRLPASAKWMKAALWIMMLLFTLNTLGNLASQNAFEKLVFTPLTFLLSILLFVLIRSERKLSEE